MMRKALPAALLACLTLLLAADGYAGIKLIDEKNKYLEVGGRIQVQYRYLSPEGEESVDDIFFRRLRPYLMGSVTENWVAKVQVDFGQNLNQNEIAIKDAYFAYRGAGWAGLEIRIGNTKHAFSREYLTSSKRQQQVERTFVGNHNYGMIDRVLGVMAQGRSNDGKLDFIVGVGAENFDPDARRMDFDSPANDEEDWNQGWTVSGRLDYHPMGHLKRDQGDFHSEQIKATVGAAGFGWWNDGDRNTYTNDDGTGNNDKKVDLKEAYGVEISGGLRGHGASFDAEYHRVSGKTEVGDFTGGLYRNGETDMNIAAVQGGYMVVRKALELAVAWDMLDATNYQDYWQRLWIGGNWFLNKHKLKFQAGYQINWNTGGVRDRTLDQVLVQGQFVF